MWVQVFDDMQRRGVNPTLLSYRELINGAADNAQIDVVHESATEVVQQDGVKRLTLITCYPFDAITPGGPLRYVVRAFGEFTEDGTPFPVAS